MDSNPSNARDAIHSVSRPLSPSQNDISVLEGFADAGHLSDSHKDCSQTGYVFTTGKTAISWRSTKQTLVTTSSNHAKIIALHEAVRECIWLRSIVMHVKVIVV